MCLLGPWALPLAGQVSFPGTHEGVVQGTETVFQISSQDVLVTFAIAPLLPGGYEGLTVS